METWKRTGHGGRSSWEDGDGGWVSSVQEPEIHDTKEGDSVGGVSEPEVGDERAYLVNKSGLLLS